MVTKEVLKFLEDQNRPFSLNDIIQGAKSDAGKAAVQKALNTLVDKGDVIEKVYGKQKVYFIKQKNDLSASAFKENLLTIEREITSIADKLKETNDKLGNNKAKLSEFKGKITLEEAVDRKLQLEKELKEVNEGLGKYQDVEIVCSKDKTRMEKAYNEHLSEYKKRKRMCMDALNAILENYPKSKKHLFEDIGIETDEDVQFVVSE